MNNTNHNLAVSVKALICVSQCEPELKQLKVMKGYSV